MKRRTILLMATMAAALIVAGGVALAETVNCNATPPCHGTPEGDFMTGTVNGETIYAYGGNDFVNAGGGSDTVYGSDGNDGIEGGFSDDTLYGQGGADTLDAQTNDVSPTTDHSYGGGGNDTIHAVDSNVDIINCGKGTDTVHYNEGVDRLKACEIKNP